MTVKVFSLSSSAQQKLNSCYNSASTQTFCDDDLVITSDKYNLTNKRGLNLNTSNVFTGNINKIKDIHFLKTTVFDREHFKNLYPNINIRYKPNLSDVIVYDEKALYNNDNPQIHAIKTKSNDYIINQNDIYYFQKMANISINKNNYFSTMKIGKVLFDDNKSDIIRSIITDINSKNYERVYLSEPNEYFEELVNSNKPYLHVNNVLKDMESSNRTNNLTINEVLTLFDQITSSDLTAVKAAAESVLMVNTKKYLPIQIILIGLAIKKVQSKKIDLFSQAFELHKYIHYVNGHFFALIPVLELINNIIASEKQTDINLFAQFINSSNFFEHYFASINNKYKNIIDIQYLIRYKNDIFNIKYEDSPEKHTKKAEPANNSNKAFNLEEFCV